MYSLRASREWTTIHAMSEDMALCMLETFGSRMDVQVELATRPSPIRSRWMRTVADGASVRR